MPATQIIMILMYMIPDILVYRWLTLHMTNEEDMARESRRTNVFSSSYRYCVPWNHTRNAMFFQTKVIATVSESWQIKYDTPHKRIGLCSYMVPFSPSSINAAWVKYHISNQGRRLTSMVCHRITSYQVNSCTQWTYLYDNAIDNPLQIFVVSHADDDIALISKIPSVGSIMYQLIKSPWVTEGLIVFVPFPPPPPFCQHFLNLRAKPLKLISSNHIWFTYECGKKFGTHLGDLGSRSPSYWSGAEFNLSPW